ncbi:MAG: glycoside hydrolase family 31 protein [Propionibacteriaceae bacterium]
MPALPPHLRPTTTPATDPAVVIAGPRYRISMLTPRLVRFEWSPSGQFTDAATQVVWNRGLPVADFALDRDGDALQIRTPFIQVDYDGQEFSAAGLVVRALGVSNYRSVWRFGETEKPEMYGIPTNLRGTARTLDEADGPVPLEPGLLSVNGIAVLDDSDSLTIDEGGWFVPRPPDTIDVYVFAYGWDFVAAIKDFYALTGPQPLLPRFALGNWWSRYHPYSDPEYRELIGEFERANLPFSVGVLDMDWHLVDIDPTIGSGWTGYTWNPELFPDPPAFLAWLHEHGLKVALNVHPADGILRHEKSYEQVARHVGIDPASGAPVVFDLVNPKFREAYFDLVHHPLEEEGVDFWWLDWQQGHWSTVPGLDPLWLLNHLHFLDSGRDGRRPLTFSRYAGPGSHRYPVGFSGDTVISWASLAFQPYFTATASNIGYGWWSHDIGGHMFGVKDDELATRWLQLGCFSPINRLHSTLSPFNSKEPWRFNTIAEAIQSDTLRFRHRLVPYLYTMNERAHSQGRPLVEPLYWGEPVVEALAAKTSFRFGSELLVAPITSPAVGDVGVASVETRLPHGTWVDTYTGVVYDGGRNVTMHRGLDTYPVLAKAGGIVPLTGPDDLRVENPEVLEVRVYAGADGTFTLYEDDDAAEPRAARTPIVFDWSAGRLTIGPAVGNLDVIPAVRDWTVTLVGAARTTAVGHDSTWDAATGSLTVHLGRVASAQPATVTFDGPLTLGDNDVARRVYALVDRAQVPFAAKQAVVNAVLPGRDAAVATRDVLELHLDPVLEAAVLELVMARLP